MRTEYMHYLLEVARSESISAAAKKLFLGQTTLSAIVNSVEDDLQIKIFERTHKGIRLTPEGEAAIPLMEEIYNRSRALKSLHATRRSVRQVVNLVAYPTACNHLGLHLTRRLAAEHPETILYVHETPYNKVIQRVSEGMARIAVGSESSKFFSRQISAMDRGFGFKAVYTDRFRLVVNRRSPFAGQAPVPVAELYDQHLCTAHFYPLSADSPLGQMFRSFDRFTVLPNSQIIKRAVVQNDMVAIMPGLELVDEPLVKNGELRVVEVTGFPLELTIFVVHTDGLSDMEQQMLDEIFSYYAALPTVPTTG